METRGMTKRKFADSFNGPTSPAKRNKRQAFTAPYDALTKTTIIRNGNDSVLLKLPAEIRQLIWRALLGDRVIHVCHRPRDHVFSELCDPESPSASPNSICTCWSERSMWRHGECTSQHTEIERFELWKRCTRARAVAEAGENTGPKTMCLDACHCACLPKLVDVGQAPDDQPAELRLGVLRACRQIYVEANPVLWHTNTFSFDDANDFKLFIEDRNTLQKQLLRKLRFDMTIFNTGPNRWSDVFSMSLIKSLKGLRLLHADISYEFSQLMVDSWSREDEHQYTSIGGLLKFMVLPLTMMTVMMTCNPQRLDSKALIKAGSELRFVEEVISRVLDANGPGNWRKQWVFKDWFLFKVPAIEEP